LNRSIKFGIGIIIVLVVAAGLWSYHTDKLYKESYMSDYNYRITLETDSALKDLTLYIPLPLFKEESKIGAEIIAGNVSKTDDWNFSIVETVHGKMLKITAKEFIPEYHSLPIPIEPGKEPKELPKPNISDTFSKETPVLTSKEITVMLHAYHNIDSKNPIGNEPLLSPKYNITLSSYDVPYPEGWTPPTVHKYESCVYADYTASSSAKISVYVMLEGRNSWWVYGWSFNDFTDRIEATITGEQRGWLIVTGKLAQERVDMFERRVNTQPRRQTKAAARLC
jgi:hypothetical protein